MEVIEKVRTPREIRLHRDTVHSHGLQHCVCVPVIVLYPILVVNDLLNWQDVLAFGSEAVLGHADRRILDER